MLKFRRVILALLLVVMATGWFRHYPKTPGGEEAGLTGNQPAAVRIRGVTTVVTPGPTRIYGMGAVTATPSPLIQTGGIVIQVALHPERLQADSINAITDTITLNPIY